PQLAASLFRPKSVAKCPFELGGWLTPVRCLIRLTKSAHPLRDLTAMARKESDNSHRSAAQLRSLRSHIDKLDLQILKLVNERAGLAAEIGRVKSNDGGEVFNPAREEEVYQNVLHANKGPLDE